MINFVTMINVHIWSFSFLSSCYIFQKEYELSFHALFAQIANFTGNLKKKKHSEKQKIRRAPGQLGCSASQARMMENSEPPCDCLQQVVTRIQFNRAFTSSSLVHGGLFFSVFPATASVVSYSAMII